MTKLNELDPQERTKAISQLFGKDNGSVLIAKLADDIEMYKETMAMATDETARAGSMQGEYDARAATTSNQLQLLKNNLTEMGVNVGAVLLPALNSIAETLSPIITKIAEFAEKNPEITRMAIAFLLVVAALGPLIVIIGTVVSSIGSIIGAFNAVKLAMTGFKIASMASMLPLILIIALVIGLAVLAWWVITNWAQVKAFFINLWAAIRAGWQGLKVAVAMAVIGMVQAVTNAIERIKSKFEEIKSRAQAAWQGVKTAAAMAVVGMIIAFTNGVSRIRGAMNTIKTTIISTLTSAAAGARAAGQRIVTAIADGIRAGIGAVSSAASAVASAVKSKLPNSPVPEGPLRILNGSHNAGYKITEMIALGMNKGTGLVGSAASQSVSGVNPVSMAASAGTGTSNSSTFAPTVTINVNGGGNPQAVGEEVKRQVSELFAQFQQQQSRQNWLSYS
jgi:phage-related protein